MRAFRRLVGAIETEGSAALVTLTRVEGSSPREAGARMVVRPSGGFHGTIGGGALEWAALVAAQATLQQGRRPAERPSLALGPELAQCCGGRVEWRIETFDRRWIPTRSATPSTALVPQQKVGFPIPNPPSARFPRDKGGSARRNIEPVQ